MEVHFTPEQEAQLAQLASHAGKRDAEHLVKDAALLILEQAERFRQVVERGKAAAARGEFVQSEQVWADIEEILRS